MTTDRDALHSALISIAMIANKLHATRKALPEGCLERPALEVLAHAESDLKVAKALIASEMGFDLCEACWPPEILIPDFGKVQRCPQCETLSVGAYHKDKVMIGQRQTALWEESLADVPAVEIAK